jgi:hypothetical protein
MRNTTTEQEVLCRSGAYWFEESLADMNVAIGCMQACARHGFAPVKPNPYATAYAPLVVPTVPDDDIGSSVPAECLP